MKFLIDADGKREKLSHPSRGAWIEIATTAKGIGGAGRTPHGVRGLK